MPNLSTYTRSLLEAIDKIVNKQTIEESETIDVSKTVSFFALVYERFRNVIEFKDEHIIRRNAINRILVRRLAFNPDLVDEAASIAKEIVWAGYYKTDKIPESKINRLEKIIDWYISLRNFLVRGEGSRKHYYAEFIRDLLVCQIEELFAEKESQIERTFLFYFYQVLNPQIVVEGLEKDEKDLLFYIASERVFLKSDYIYLRFRLFKLLFEDLLKVKKEDFVEKAAEFKKAFAFIDKYINDKHTDRKIVRYLTNIRPAYLILKEFVLRHKDSLNTIFSDEKKIRSYLDALCREKYAQSKERLTRAGIRSFIYIFLTKMLLVFIAEYPIMANSGDPMNYTALGINALFPPLLMALFVFLTGVPGEDNTQKIYEKVTQFIYEGDKKPVVFKHKKTKPKNFMFNVFFWAFYFTTFAVTFWLINIVLNFFSFPWYSKLIFVFFVTAVSFFGFRIRKVALEYQIKEKESVLQPVVDFFMIPLISVGKWLSNEISKLNVLIFIFDFLIEAPFKVLFEVIEEWISFVRRRKEEII